MGLDIVHFIMATETEFNVSFDNVELSRIRTVGEFYELVLKELRRQQSYLAPEQSTSLGLWNDGEVWTAIRRLLVETQGMKPEQITPGARFVDDLAMD